MTTVRLFIIASRFVIITRPWPVFKLVIVLVHYSVAITPDIGYS